MTSSEEVRTRTWHLIYPSVMVAELGIERCTKPSLFPTHRFSILPNMKLLGVLERLASSRPHALRAKQGSSRSTLSMSMGMDVNRRFLIESLEIYADRSSSECRLSVSHVDGDCRLSSHGMVFRLNVVENVIGIEACLPKVRSLSKGCVEQLRDELLVKVAHSDDDQATVSQYLRSDLLLDDDAFHSSIDDFVVLALWLAI